MEWGNDYPYGALRPQGPLVSDECSSSSDLRLYSLYPAQVILLTELRFTTILSTNMDIQAYFTGVHSSLQSSPIQGIAGGRTNCPESVLPPV